MEKSFPALDESFLLRCHGSVKMGHNKGPSPESGTRRGDRSISAAPESVTPERKHQACGEDGAPARVTKLLWDQLQREGVVGGGGG